MLFLDIELLTTVGIVNLRQMKRQLSTYDIKKDSTERIQTHFPALWTGTQCIKANLNCDRFVSIKIVIDVIIDFLWFLKLHNEEHDRTPQFVYATKYF